jgi:hypothetical protein
MSENAGNPTSKHGRVMLWLLASLFFFWCAFREIRNSVWPAPGYAVPIPVTPSYLGLVLGLAVICAWPPVHTWSFQRFLSAKATLLADQRRAHVHCNTLFDTMLDPEMLAAGHASPVTGNMVLQKPWCGILMDYLRHPQHASDKELFSLGMFTHESMHIRGEMNEASTECQAVQRNYRAAKLLGVPDATARQNALDYYHNGYQERGRIGGMQSAYYSAECAPGEAMDEHLPDSTWGTP